MSQTTEACEAGRPTAAVKGMLIAAERRSRALAGAAEPQAPAT
jgi:hypothetical protein